MRIFKEPLVHFLLIGFVFFGLYRVVNRREPARFDILVSAQKMQELTAAFSNDWNREPTAEEREQMIDEYVREELAFREGMELGLNENDPVIRQRLQQKLEFMAEEQAAQLKPTDEELETFLRAHANLFAEEGVVPNLDQIRNMVIFEWENEQRLKFLGKKYDALREKYNVVIEEQVQ